MSKEPGEAIIDIIVRFWLLIPAQLTLGDWQTTVMVGVGLVVFYTISYFLQEKKDAVKYIIIMLFVILLLYILGGSYIQLFNIPTNIYSLATIISVKLLPLSAFPKLELAATALLWVFIGLMFAGAEWKQMLLMLAIGGVAMGFLSSLGVFAVADSEIAASYNDLVQNTKVKNQTASGVSNIWLMLSNPRLWYETQYGYKNETLAQGDQTSPFALEITKAEVLEKVAPPGGEVTFDIRLENKGKRTATVRALSTEVGTLNGVGKLTTENLGSEQNKGNGALNNVYDRYLKSAVDTDAKIDALRKADEDPNRMYSYFESTPGEEAHYKFCDNPTSKEGLVSQDITGEVKEGTFESGSIDEPFGSFKSPLCYGKHKVTASLAYSYDVTGTYNLELINSDYFKELLQYKKLKTHIEDSKSTEGPLKLTIRSVPEEQPVRLDSSKKEITVFYSLNNVGPGTAVIKSPGDIQLEGVGTDITLSKDCNFAGGTKACLSDSTKKDCVDMGDDAVKNFRKTPMKDLLGVKGCTFENSADSTGKNNDCLTFSPDDPNSIVLLKCKFTYAGDSFDTTKTLFMKMHVNYDYITSRTAQYETTPMPGYHPCVTKRELDGFANKTDMDLYLKTLFKDATIGNAGDVTEIKAFLDTSAGTLGNTQDLCVKDA